MKGRVESIFYVSISVGMALATSSFTMVSGLFATATAPVVLSAIALAGLVCVIIALSIGELASMYPSAPGVRTYFKIAFGDRPSLILVYQYLIFVVLIAGLESFVFSEIVRAVFPAIPPLATILVLIGAVAVTNMAGFELPRSVQVLTTVVAVALIAVSGAIGASHPRVAASTLFSGSAARSALMVPGLAGMSVFLYTGFEWVTPLGLRASAYERKVPASMPAAIAILFAAYAFFAIGAASQLSPAEIAATPTPQVPYFIALWGARGAYVALVLSLMAVVSTFNAGMLGGSQLIFLLAQERKLPAWCGAVSLRTSCPIGAILLLAGLAAAAGATVLRFRVELLAALVGASTMCVIYSAFLVAALKLRREKPDARRPFKSPVVESVQGALAAVLVVMAVQTLLSEPGAWLRTSVVAAASVLVASALAWRSSSGRAVEGRSGPVSVR
jgi:amino acid transporter